MMLPRHMVLILILACGRKGARDDRTPFSEGTDSATDSGTGSLSDSGDADTDTDIDTDTDTDSGDDTADPPVEWGELGAVLASYVGETSGIRAGFRLAGLADIDGDEVGEIVITAPYASEKVNYTGAVYVVRGQNDKKGSLLDAPLRIHGEAAYDWAGQSVGVGDVTGDGQPDLVIGAPGNDGGDTDAGAIYVVAATASGEVSLASAARVVAGSVTGGQFGGSLWVGEFTGEGPLDIIVGASVESTGADAAGAAYLFEGGWSGEQTAEDATAHVVGDLEGGQLGVSTGGGDLDGDGIDEMILGAASEGTGNEGSGFVLVLSGPPSGTLSPDDSDLILTGSTFGDHLGNAVAGGADVNGDGYGDMALAAYWESAYEDRNGAVYVIYGPVDIKDPEEADAIIRGETEYGYAGISVSLLADATGDGLGDLLIGEYGARGVEDAKKSTGAVHLFAEVEEGSHTVSDATLTLNGDEDFGAYGYSSVGTPDVNGDGLNDLLVGAYQSEDSTGRILLYSGGPPGR